MTVPATKDIQNFTDNVLEKFTEQLTDQVFLFIENNPTFKQDYEQLVKTKNLKYLNSCISKAVKEGFVLKNKGGRNTDPQSILIKGNTKFK